jgi:hypothetical protein
VNPGRDGGPEEPAGTEQGQDAGVIEASGDLDLTQEPRGPHRGRQIRPQELQRDGPAVAAVGPGVYSPCRRALDRVRRANRNEQ